MPYIRHPPFPRFCSVNFKGSRLCGPRAAPCNVGKDPRAPKSRRPARCCATHYETRTTCCCIPPTKRSEMTVSSELHVQLPLGSLTELIFPKSCQTPNPGKERIHTCYIWDGYTQSKASKTFSWRWHKRIPG